jgi:hypothetical protein
MEGDERRKRRERRKQRERRKRREMEGRLKTKETTGARR